MKTKNNTHFTARRTLVSSSMLTMLLLSACGGGGGDVGSPPATAAISQQFIHGVAARGAPIAAANVELFCSNAPDSAAGASMTDSNGAYRIALPLSGAAATPLLPCLLRLVVPGGTLVLHAAATEAGLVNITPLSDLQVAHSANLLDAGSALAAFRNAGSGQVASAPFTAARLQTAWEAVRAMIGTLGLAPASNAYLLALSSPTGIAFNASPGDPFDAMLDQLGLRLSALNLLLPTLLAQLQGKLPTSGLLVDAPMATAGTGVPVVLTATQAQSPNGTIARYIWSFGDGSPDVITTVPTARQTYPQPGNYTASLVIVDAAGVSSAAATQNVVVQAVTPLTPLPVLPAAPVGISPQPSEPTPAPAPAPAAARSPSPPPPPPPPPPAQCRTQTVSWTVDTNVCMGTVATYSPGTSRPVQNTLMPNIGEATYLCNNGFWSLYGAASAPTCTAPPFLAVAVSTDPIPKVTFAGTATGDIFLALDGPSATFSRQGSTAGQMVPTISTKIIEFGTGEDTLVLTSKLISLTVDGKAGNDQIVLANVVNDNAAVLTLTSVERVTGGTMADTITIVSSTGVIIDGGAGNDRITGGAGADTITLGLGDDVVVANSTINAIDTITDFKAAGMGSDKFSTSLSASSVTSLTIASADTATLAVALNAAMTGANALSSPRQAFVITVTAGTAAGTYVFQNNGSSPTTVDTSDFIVKLGAGSGTPVVTDFVAGTQLNLSAGTFNSTVGVNDEFLAPSSGANPLQGITINGNPGDTDVLILNAARNYALNNGGTGGTISNIKAVYLAGTGTNTIVFAAAGSGGIAAIYGGAGNDSVDLANTGTAFLAGTVSLGAGQNTLVLEAGVAYAGLMAAGTGTNDTLTLRPGSNISGATVTGFETLSLAGTGNYTMTVPQLNSFNNINAFSNETLIFTTPGTIVAPFNIERFQLANGTNTFSAGNNTVSVTGGTGSDTFNYSATQIGGATMLDGGDGADVLNISPIGSNLNISTLVTNVETVNVTGSFATGYTFSNMNGAGARLNFSKGSVQDSIQLGNGGQTVNVQGGLGTRVAIKGGPGADFINLQAPATAAHGIRSGSTNAAVDTIRDFSATRDRFVTGQVVTTLNSVTIALANLSTYINDIGNAIAASPNILAADTQAYLITVQAGTAAGTYVLQNTGSNPGSFDNTDYFVKLISLTGTITPANFVTGF